MARDYPDNKKLVEADFIAGDALIKAVRKNEIETARSILENDASQVNEPESVFGQTPMHVAASNGNVDMMELLAVNGADVNVVDGFNEDTPLHYAAGQDNAEAIAFLLDKEAEINAANKSGQTALDIATLAGNKDIATLLLDRGGVVLADNKEQLEELTEKSLRLSSDKNGVEQYGLEGKFEKAIGSSDFSMML